MCHVLGFLIFMFMFRFCGRFGGFIRSLVVIESNWCAC